MFLASHRYEVQLAGGLAAAAEVDGVAFVAVGLDAIRVDVHHQAADLAAKSCADNHRGVFEGHRPRAGAAIGTVGEAGAAPGGGQYSSHYNVYFIQY